MQLGTVNVSFKHNLGEKQTICEVTQDDNFKNLGVAQCSANDQYCRDTGRKISLSRAIKPLPRDVRASVWEDYRTMSKNPRW